MKKALFATTALVMTAGIAAADVTISGYGRTGILYQEDGVRGDGTTNSAVISRLRMNIDASMSTDQGVDFGGRIRLQWDQGQEETAVSPGYIYVTASGLRVEIGNANTAFDSTLLQSASELGVYDRSFGTNRGAYYAYNSRGYPRFTDTTGRDGVSTDYLGIMATYAIDDLTIRASYVDPNQVSNTDDRKKEYGLNLDYIWNQFEFSAAATMNGASIDGNDVYFVGARYTVNDQARVGIAYNDNGFVRDRDVTTVFNPVTGNFDVDTITVTDIDFGKTFTLYGDYTMDLLNFEAYYAHNDANDNDTDNAFGLGVNYDLGGARVSGSIQRGYQKLVTADMGVRFDF